MLFVKSSNFVNHSVNNETNIINFPASSVPASREEGFTVAKVLIPGKS